MAYFQIDRDGTEWISSEPMIRYPKTIVIKSKNNIRKLLKCPIEKQTHWEWPYMTDGNIGEVVMLPKGSIERLLGRILTFEDEPIYIGKYLTI